MPFTADSPQPNAIHCRFSTIQFHLCDSRFTTDSLQITAIHRRFTTIPCYLYDSRRCTTDSLQFNVIYAIHGDLPLIYWDLWDSLRLNAIHYRFTTIQGHFIRFIAIYCHSTRFSTVHRDSPLIRCNSLRLVNGFPPMDCASGPRSSCQVCAFNGKPYTHAVPIPGGQRRIQELEHVPTAHEPLWSPSPHIEIPQQYM